MSLIFSWIQPTLFLGCTTIPMPWFYSSILMLLLMLLVLLFSYKKKINILTWRRKYKCSYARATLRSWKEKRRKKNQKTWQKKNVLVDRREFLCWKIASLCIRSKNVTNCTQVLFIFITFTQTLRFRSATISILTISK